MPLLAGLSSLLVISALTPLGESFGLVDRPDNRKRHDASVPVVGGLAIYSVIAGAMMVIDYPEEFHWLMLSAAIVVVVGALDDAFKLSVWLRLVSQITASIFMIVGCKVWITSLGLNFGGYQLGLGWLSVPITIFAVVGLTNAFNMIDGIDGLSSGQMLIGLLTVGLILFHINGSVNQIEWLVLLFSTVFAFWLVNLSLTPLRRIFLGDAGSLMLGFLLAWTLIYYTQKPVSVMHPVVALWCVTIPVFDTLIVIARRLKNKRPLFSPDRKHLHHLFVDTGMNPRLVLLIILTVSLAVNIFGVWLTYAIGPLVSLIVFLGLLIAFGYGILHPRLEKRLAQAQR